MIDALRMMFYIFETPSLNITQVISLPTFESIGCPTCPGKNRYQCSEGLACFARFYTSSAYRPGGTCRMGDVKRDDVVVDPTLKIKGLNKLRVCDASIFPALPNANPTAAVLMVGEKCAQLIKDSYNIN